MLSLVFTTSAVTPEQRVAFLQSSEYDYASPYTAPGGAPSQLPGQPQDMGYGARPAPPSRLGQRPCFCVAEIIHVIH